MQEIDTAVNDQIDAACRARYRRYPPCVAPRLTPEVRSTTIQLVPLNA